MLRAPYDVKHSIFIERTVENSSTTSKMLGYKNMTRKFTQGTGRVLMTKKKGDVNNTAVLEMKSEC